MDVSEGVPLIAATIGGVHVTRLVPDLGSRALVIPRFFADTNVDAAALQITGPRKRDDYLEGAVTLDGARIASLQIGTYTMSNVPALVEPHVPLDIDIPLDAIAGTSILDSFEWWFDYDGGQIYIRPR